jgi:hypothetical protein
VAKQTLYYIFKITTSTLADANFNINKLTPAEARTRGELISVGDNQTFMFIRKIRNKRTNFRTLENLYSERDEIKALPHSSENSKKVAEKQVLIDDILFVDDVVNVTVDNNKIYLDIGRHGFFINNKKYKRLSCGAGQARRNTVTFVSEDIYNQINEIQMNGLKIDKINLSKFSAYFGLYTSSIQVVKTPRVCLVDDCELQLFDKKVDWIADKVSVDPEGNITEYREVEERTMDLPMNVCDGQGLISPMMASQWANDLELEYLPCQFIIRSAFIKGMLTVFDFHKFASEVANTSTITDYYGKEWNVNEIDVLLSISQFKMYKYYSTWDNYIENCKKYGHVWGVSRWTPKRDNIYSLLNYQYIQTLNLNHDELLELAKPTIEWINKICSGDKLYTLLFLFGVTDKISSIDDILNRTGNDYVKAILYNDELLQDPHIQKKIYQSISRCIKDAKIGRLWVKGNYQMMVADPYAQAQKAFNLTVTGLLKEFEHYNKGKTGIIDACRSPLVDFSEHNILNYVNNSETSEWYRYMYSGVVYNVWGLDTIRHSD